MKEQDELNIKQSSAPCKPQHIQNLNVKIGWVLYGIVSHVQIFLGKKNSILINIVKQTRLVRKKQSPILGLRELKLLML
ncbi:hypothetical protein Avbf_02171 [Armadillidium vulgare]|nr:hypothetical protein Avbf_02171 [Armadillidium vulgare]